MKYSNVNNIEKKRESNFELLRIFSIIIILLSHFNVHTYQAQFVDKSSFSPTFFTMVLLSLGGLGNVLFLMITGYFTIKKNISYKRIIALILQMYFYSISAYIITLLIGKHSFTFSDLKSTFLPFLYGNWFCVCYIIFCLFIPFINKLLNNLNKKQHFQLVAIMFIVFSVFPIFLKINYTTNLSIFFFSYIIGAYIKTYNLSIKNSRLTIYFIFTFLLMALLTFIKYNRIIQTGSNPTFANIGFFVVNTCSPFIIALAIVIFLRFKNITVNSTFINTIAKSTLGVYLIHDNVLIRELLWKQYDKTNLINMPIIQYLSCAIISITIIFITCTVIDYLRRKILGNLEEKLSNIICAFGKWGYKKTTGILKK